MNSQQLGQLLRDVRRRQKLSQRQIAGAAGVGLRFVVELERGKPTVQLGKALQVLQALGCKLRVELPAESA